MLWERRNAHVVRRASLERVTVSPGTTRTEAARVAPPKPIQHAWHLPNRYSTRGTTRADAVRGNDLAFLNHEGDTVTRSGWAHRTTQAHAPSHSMTAGALVTACQALALPGQSAGTTQAHAPSHSMTAGALVTACQSL